MTTLKEYHVAAHTLLDIEFALYDEAKILALAGNQVVADRLFRIAQDIGSSRKTVDAYVGDELKDKVQSGFNHMGSLLQTAMAIADERAKH